MYRIPKLVLEERGGFPRAQAVFNELQEERPGDGRGALRAVNDAAAKDDVMRPLILHSTISMAQCPG